MKKSKVISVLLLTLFIAVNASGGVKSKCKKAIKKLTGTVKGVKKKVDRFKGQITNVERNLDKAKSDVNRMNMSPRKKVLLKSVLDAAKRAIILSKYYMKIKSYHKYVAGRIKKAAKPGIPNKWWGRIKKARKVVSRLVSLAKELPARIHDANMLLKDIRLIIKNASAVTG